MNIEANVKLLLDVFSAIEQRNDQRFRELVHPEFEIHWPPSLPYGGTVRGLAHAAPTWSETWIPLQPTEAERRMDPRVVAASEDEVVVLWRQRGVTPSWIIGSIILPKNGPCLETIYLVGSSHDSATVQWWWCMAPGKK